MPKQQFKIGVPIVVIDDELHLSPTTNGIQLSIYNDTFEADPWIMPIVYGRSTTIEFQVISNDGKIIPAGLHKVRLVFPPNKDGSVEMREFEGHLEATISARDNHHWNTKQDPKVIAYKMTTRGSGTVVYGTDNLETIFEIVKAEYGEQKAFTAVIAEAVRRANEQS